MHGNRLSRIVKLVKGGQKEDGTVPVLLPDLLRCLQSRDAGHLDVQQQDIRPLFLIQLQYLASVLRLIKYRRFLTELLAQLFQQYLPLDGLIICHQDSVHTKLLSSI